MSQDSPTGKSTDQRGIIELRLRDLNQLFNTMDPSPFPERDLDADAEEFIVGWAKELPRDLPLVLLIHLTDPKHEDPASLIERGIETYFAHKAHLSRMQLRQVLSRGRSSLMIGLAFLAVCLGIADQLGRLGENPPVQIIQESFIIAGWVAMWRPMEIFLYDWWPIVQDRRIFRRLSDADVRVTLSE